MAYPAWARSIVSRYKSLLKNDFVSSSDHQQQHEETTHRQDNLGYTAIDRTGVLLQRPMETSAAFMRRVKCRTK